MQLVNSFLEKSAERLPDKVGLVYNGERLTYRQIDEMANRLANALIDHGVKRGDRVELVMQNSAALVASIFAVLKANAVFVVLNPSTKEQKLHYVIDNCRATAVISSGSTVDELRRIIVRAPSLKFAVVADPRHRAEVDESVHRFEVLQTQYPHTRPKSLNIDRDLACLVYTSGSTGRSKGVMCTHANMVFAATSVTTYLGTAEEDIILDVMPLSFDYGLYQVLMAFKMGATLVLERSFAFPANILRTAESERVTGFPGVPTIFNMILNMDLSRFDLSSIRYITSTAAALPIHYIEELKQRFPQATIYSMYGLTETQRTLYLPPEQLMARPDSVGIAIPGTEVWLEDDEGKRSWSGRGGRAGSPRRSCDGRLLGDAAQH